MSFRVHFGLLLPLALGVFAFLGHIPRAYGIKEITIAIEYFEMPPGWEGRDLTKSGPAMLAQSLRDVSQRSDLRIKVIRRDKINEILNCTVYLAYLQIKKKCMQIYKLIYCK